MSSPKVKKALMLKMKLLRIFDGLKSHRIFDRLCLFINCLRHESPKACIVKDREISLLIAGILGVMLALLGYCLFAYCGLNGTPLQANITLLFLGLPTFFVLWIFRTHDVQRQLDKTQESIDNSSFLECARMLLEDESSSKKTALSQLAYLKEQTEFNKSRIDFMTKRLYISSECSKQSKLSDKQYELSYARLYGLDLSEAKLFNVDLTGADLHGTILNNAELRKASLRKANLRGTSLQEADLWHAELQEADLRGAKMQGVNLLYANLLDAKLQKADLSGANLKHANLLQTNLTGTILLGAQYSMDTKFPSGFDPKEAGAVFHDE